MKQDYVGVFQSIPNKDYHGGPGVSKSGLDLIACSPLHYRWATDASNDNQPTPAQRIGTLAHDMILEPDQFWNRYAVPLDPQDFPEAIHSRDELVAMVDELNTGRLPKLSASGSKEELAERILQAAPDAVSQDDLQTMKVGDLKALIGVLNEDRPGLLSTRGSMKELVQILAEHGRSVELWSDLVAMNEQTNDGKTIISADEFALAQAMRDAVMSHPAAAGLLAGVPGWAELSAYWIDPITGVLCRCRPDWWRSDGIIVDLKTTDDASPEGFSKSLLNWRYHVQAPFYLDGARLALEQGPIGEVSPPAPTHFVFVVVEKKPPHAVAVYKLDLESMELGRREYMRDLGLYAECLRSNTWPGYGDKIQQLALPEWYLKRSAMGE